MGQILHGCATTTHAVRTAIQDRRLRSELAARYGLNHKTVAKWRKRAFVNGSDGAENAALDSAIV
jgi:transposase-like protein